jgi:hypothetical protein
MALPSCDDVPNRQLAFLLIGEQGEESREIWGVAHPEKRLHINL